MSCVAISHYLTRPSIIITIMTFIYPRTRRLDVAESLIHGDLACALIQIERRIALRTRVKVILAKNWRLGAKAATHVILPRQCLS
jgi:hypothetical protein